ncbi:hypothetical protein [Burkholderia ubonensis]|uniref:hypothetical protein n=1 Tax=Burkholderia ubonensis TaxID=101571 RepID=UPI000A65D64F|nr:hypothetical protein [Burkholderia ubonensis]
MISIDFKRNGATLPTAQQNNYNSEIENSSNFFLLGLKKNIVAVKNSRELSSGCKGRVRSLNAIGINKESSIKNTELKWMHAGYSGNPGLDVKNIQLAAYLTARSTINRTIEGEQLHGLRKANDTVNAARDLLPYGRANVTADVAKSPETYWRNEFMSFRPQGLGSVARYTAMVMKVGAGNCGAHAAVTTGVHAKKLSLGETLLVCSAQDFDHQWSETVLPSGDRVVMDAWADGPAVMAEDSKFSPNVDCRDVDGAIQQVAGKQFSQEIEIEMNSLNATGEVDRACSAHLEFKNKYWLGGAPKGKYPPTLVFHPDFNTSVTAQQDPGHAQKILGDLETHSSVSSKLKLGMDVKAVGAARSVGANIRQALDTKGQILAVLEKNSADKTGTSFFRENVGVQWLATRNLISARRSHPSA